MITDHMIIRESGQYDKEIIPRLRLERMALQRISNLESCISLVELSLSSNDITVISGLENLTALKILDLSFNKIRKIENISTLVSLESFNLKGNVVSSVEDIGELKDLLELKTLHLKGVDGEDANPVCKHPTYMNVILRTLPNLQIIDGGHLTINESFLTIEEHMNNLQPEPRLCKTPPLEHWLTDKDTAAANKEIEDVEGLIGGLKVFKEVLESQSKVNDMLNEECSHLLRKAQTVMSKSAKT